MAPEEWEGIFMANLLTLEIIAGYTRPVFSLKNNITCLIDTGADTPVWTQGVDRLNDAFQAEQIKGKKFFLSGFGTGHEIVDVYRVSELELLGTGERIVFKNIVVACISRPTMVADLILPNTAFTHMNVILRNMDVEAPIVEIEHKKEEYYVNPIYSSVDDSYRLSKHMDRHLYFLLLCFRSH